MMRRCLLLAAVAITAVVSTLITGAVVSADDNVNEMHSGRLRELRRIVLETAKHGETQWNFFSPAKRVGERNGGSKCAACTLLVGLVAQVRQLNHGNDQNTTDTFCAGIADKNAETVCRDLVGILVILDSLVDPSVTDSGADAACHAIKMCETEPGQPTCRLFQPKTGRRVAPVPPNVAGARLRRNKRFREVTHNLRSFNICAIPIFAPLCRDIEQVVDHLPAIDVDGDRFAPYSAPTLRGSNWRGGDCDDSDPTVHPGRTGSDATKDGNCNCISGVDPSDGVAWEDKFCNAAGLDPAYGISILGDSATAHFGIPAAIFKAQTLFDAGGAKVFKGFLAIAENEADWPQISWATGYMNSSRYEPYDQEPSRVAPNSDSFYMDQRKINLCSTGYRQNLGVNGARASKLTDWVELLGAVGPNNKPQITIMAMIGNDVCNSQDSVSSMTTPQEFYNAYLQAVLKADATLPPGSKVILVGLATGTILYNTMGHRTHPLGQLNNDVLYSDLYDFLNCLSISPCHGWLTSNETVRNRTQQHADLLSAQLQRVVDVSRDMIKNIEVMAVLNWTSAISEAPIPEDQRWRLIEPVDGFHESSLGSHYINKYIVNKTSLFLNRKVNPNNAAIRQQFPNLDRCL